ncbi:MAG: shikimate dehydrogenase [Clostridium sp.]|nr:shikimate dehydrogenase [Prevotella sp.]MCM1429178.1 shikimate dehydrogenase [Clostridium sp.]MCM1475848.1 shikimate dehydrogenase [Muribaculaceae bacterium]
MKAIYGLVGRHLSHSYSADMFNSKFGAENIDAEYVLFPMPDISSLKSFVDEDKRIRGLNVTIPYKQSVIPLLDSVSSLARAVGAVNTIRVDRSSEGKVTLHGYNTDVRGFKDSLKPLLSPGVDKALVFGTGGASLAVLEALRELDIQALRVSRNGSPLSENIITYSYVTPDLIAHTPLLINATPLGMWPDVESRPNIPYEAVGGRHIAFDLVYNPAETAFIHECALKGAKVKNGLEMLRLQGLEAWRIWNA